MKKCWIGPMLLAWLAMILAGCSASPYGNDDGSYALTTYTNSEMGYRTVVPQNWQQTDSTHWMRAADERDLTVLIQMSLVGLTRAEVEAIGKQEMDLEEFPSQQGTYVSDHLAWELYDFDFFNYYDGLVRVKMGIAESEDAWYAVLVCGDSREVRKAESYYDTLFMHVLYNFVPIEPGV